MHPELLRALVHTDNYVAGARRGTELIGASVGFRAAEDGVPSLHSHVTGIAEAAQGSGVGTALKRHQRRWALARGLGTVTWTFDPLVRRNGWFNLMRLGAEVTAYHPDFYGKMADRLNAGDAGDRVVATWVLDSERAVTALSGDGAGPGPDVDALVEAGAPTILDEGPDGAPSPIPLPTLAPGAGATLLCRVPSDIVALRRSSPLLARAWRAALRATMGAAMDDGYRAGAMSRSGCYVLVPPGASA
ncbi:MAG: GNAT family N-acetyltransferase [Actinomycetota bacterium]|nr:GNAT family N-acetyltransferase [Actinomycetota bacterium]